MFLLAKIASSSAIYGLEILTPGYSQSQEEEVEEGENYCRQLLPLITNVKKRGEEAPEMVTLNGVFCGGLEMNGS